MNTFTILTAVIVAGIVWGGLIYFLRKAMHHEKIKTKHGG
jgi:hypothetical protein